MDYIPEIFAAISVLTPMQIFFVLAVMQMGFVLAVMYFAIKLKNNH